ncbi:unnamed protein product [Amoebophrya sp. A25]|nr:unnamed protein product [Amoebophrya sp. A25]|eukprot:GSA25T00019510001.1
MPSITQHYMAEMQELLFSSGEQPISGEEPISSWRAHRAGPHVAGLTAFAFSGRLPDLYEDHLPPKSSIASSITEHTRGTLKLTEAEVEAHEQSKLSVYAVTAGIGFLIGGSVAAFTSRVETTLLYAQNELEDFRAAVLKRDEASPAESPDIIDGQIEDGVGATRGGRGASQSMISQQGRGSAVASLLPDGPPDAGAKLSQSVVHNITMKHAAPGSGSVGAGFMPATSGRGLPQTQKKGGAGGEQIKKEELGKQGKKKGKAKSSPKEQGGSPKGTPSPKGKGRKKT